MNVVHSSLVPLVRLIGMDSSENHAAACSISLLGRQHVPLGFSEYVRKFRISIGRIRSIARKTDEKE